MPPAKTSTKAAPKAAAKPRRSRARKPKVEPKAAEVVALPPPPVPEAKQPEPEPEPASPKPRSTVTLETFVELIDSAIQKCDEGIDKAKKNPAGKGGGGSGVKTFRSVRRLLKEAKSKAPKLAKGKNRRRRAQGGAGGKNSGLMTPKHISKELAAFLQVPATKPISRIEVTRAIGAYVHIKEDEKRPDILAWSYLNEGGKRNLQSAADKRIILPDAALSKLLNYAQYKKDVAAGLVTEKRKNKDGDKEPQVVTSDDLLYRTVQKLIQVHFV